eukprot:TRINITY_DN15709_c0_g1_i1.p1 TRINITY_DN15709_c0_g1~~TRINITY_DN15709_c0_g1_i1.p1  ORF type:complete len:782 (-),score=138.49 TRINITY_DN15709_c0_g1_i1:40-2385(-)
MGQTNTGGTPSVENVFATCQMCGQKFPAFQANQHWCVPVTSPKAKTTRQQKPKKRAKANKAKEELREARERQWKEKLAKHQCNKQIQRELENPANQTASGEIQVSVALPMPNLSITSTIESGSESDSEFTTATARAMNRSLGASANRPSLPSDSALKISPSIQSALNITPASLSTLSKPPAQPTLNTTSNVSLDLNIMSTTQVLEVAKNHQDEPQNLIRLPPSQVTRESLREAYRLVDVMARRQTPADDRAIGQVDIIKSALYDPKFSEHVPSDKALMMKWLYKLQLSYIRLRWDWKAAFRFKTKQKLESVIVTESLSEDLLKMSLTLESEKIPAPLDVLPPQYGSRLTRANSKGLNRKLDFNYFVTPLPLERGLAVPEDKLWDPLDEKELWPMQISAPATIVIDSGSQYTKIGEAGNEFPRYVIPSVVATLRSDRGTHKAGEAALRYIGQNSTKWKLDRVFDPLDPDWDAALALWEHAFVDLLQVDTSEHPIMMTETPDMGAMGREETMEIMFEYFNVPSLCIGNSALMSLYGVGRVNGLVVDIGNRMQVVPVNSGVIERHAIFQLRKGVTHVNNYLSDLLEEKGHYFQTAAQREEVRKIKEKFCYVSANYDEELRRPEEDIVVSYTRDSGEVIQIGRERFKCPELLFSPLKLGILDSQFALPQVIVEAVLKCSIETRVNLLSNIILVGGGTLIPGLETRLEEEVFRCLQDEHNMRALRRGNVSCVTTWNRKYMYWKGASTFATIEGWDDFCVSSSDYAEVGKAGCSQLLRGSKILANGL